MSGADNNLGGEITLTKHKKHGHTSMTDAAPKKHKHHHKHKEEEEDSDFTESSSDEDESDESEYESEEEAEPVVTVLDAVLSLIPFTKQYRAAEDAIAHLNDIKSMQAEVQRCNDLGDLLDEGLYDDVLGEMRRDIEERGTGQDYHIFNKFKYKAEEAGEWEWQPPKHLIRKAHLNKRDQGKADMVKAWKRCRQALRCVRVRVWVWLCLCA